MPTSLDYVARGLQTLRKERGLSQAELAEAAGVSTKLVSSIEQRERSPSLDTVDRICIALDVTPLELLEAGKPIASANSRRISDRAASMFRGLSEEKSERMLEVMRGVRELMDEPTRAMKPKPRRRYGASGRK